ncbi:hypothetical protein [Bacillus alkalicellulosilyticus]|uniref:hypothetical protein n=1 Tax=Alkalihalobacterium alkalicellulosilyticum TaxID=1912214 RepID=UPI000996661C|nr:hypothetical protein [Bacillus alkalicellulosilyticus]
MIKRHYNITLKTMTDYHLESFIRCPYQYYFDYISSVAEKEIKWKQAVQAVMNKVVSSFYLLPVQQQTQFALLQIIDAHWRKVTTDLFDSKIHYFLILAKIMDHLMQHVSIQNSNTTQPPLFVHEKFQTFNHELETQFAVTVDIGEWTEDNFSIKKFLVEADGELLQLYTHLMVVFSNAVFGKLPDKIEVISLVDGTCFSSRPTIADIDKGLQYLKRLKALLLQPLEYNRT